MRKPREFLTKSAQFLRCDCSLAGMAITSPGVIPRPTVPNSFCTPENPTIVKRCPGSGADPDSRHRQDRQRNIPSHPRFCRGVCRQILGAFDVR